MEQESPKGESADSPDDDLRSFTSWKLDIINCISVDPRLKDSDTRLAVILMRYLNGVTGQCNPAESTLAEQMRSSTRTIENCKNRLKEAGWLTWRRTQKSNWYVFRDENVNAMFDYLLSMEDARREERNERRIRNQFRIGNEDTRKEFRIGTRNQVRVRTRKEFRTNTSMEHQMGTPESLSGIEREGLSRSPYRAPSFDHLIADEEDSSNGST